MACVEWPVPLDMLGYGHVFASQCVQWNWPLDTSATLHV